MTALAPQLRSNLQAKLGENGYKGIYSLLLLAGMGLIVVGWRSTPVEMVYIPAVEFRIPALALVFLAFLMMVVSSRPSRLKQLIRHPQLTGVAIWGVAHLLLNGENRSVALFGALALWAIAEIFAINRRDGAWVKDAGQYSVGAEIISVVIAAVVVAILIAVHPWISGMPVY